MILEEIKVNLEDAQKKLDSAKKQIADLEENEGKIKSNLESLNKSLGKKKNEQKDAEETLADYNQKLGAT